MEMKKNNDTIWLEDNGKKIGWITFPVNKAGNIEVLHTIVDPEYGGQGLAGKLVSEFANDMKAQGKKAELSCSYAVAWFEKHPEYEEVVLKKHDETPGSCKISV